LNIKNNLPIDVAIVVLSPKGMELARRIKQILPGSYIHGLKDRVVGGDITFSETLNHLSRLFVSGRAIIGICASGILIRSLAGFLSDKLIEPPVISVAEDGSSVVPLLGGHRGANRLARSICELTGGHACVTTAGDVGLGLALDDPPQGWNIGNIKAVKSITQNLLASESVSLLVEAGDASWINQSNAKFLSDGINYSNNSMAKVRVTDRKITNAGLDLILYPPVLALGVGCERSTDPMELIKLAEKTLQDAGLAIEAVAVVVSIDLKSDENAVHALAQHLKVPARFFTAEKLETEFHRLANPSDLVFSEVGCHGVAEGAALCAVGNSGELLVEKKKSFRSTCAVGKSVVSIDPSTIGSAQGELCIIGIGPGAAVWRTQEVTEALAIADEVVGYSLYLDLVEDVIGSKPRHSSELGREEDRARSALNLAAKGRRVVLVCSGDAGIYALATLVFELLDRESDPGWNRINVSVAPGVSALQAAAARIGAPLGHDFCAISLSDLLTLPDVIESRIKAASEGDFVVAFYNPVSKRRRKLLARAREILLEKRPPETPVIIARNLGRVDEEVYIVTLFNLEVDMVDMLTLVIVGSSHTRSFKTSAGMRVYTPRGYDKKMEIVK
jgi:cobalt-precorrin 5A hydrolase/precorrin-3B C17-methyltransferase